MIGVLDPLAVQGIAERLAHGDGRLTHCGGLQRRMLGKRIGASYTRVATLLRSPEHTYWIVLLPAVENALSTPKLFNAVATKK